MSERITVRVDALTKQRWEEHARARGLSLSQLVRFALEEQVRPPLTEHGLPADIGYWRERAVAAEAERT